jgi:hypothetical protein
LNPSPPKNKGRGDKQRTKKQYTNMCDPTLDPSIVNVSRCILSLSDAEQKIIETVMKRDAEFQESLNTAQM